MFCHIKEQFFSIQKGHSIQKGDGAYWIYDTKMTYLIPRNGINAHRRSLPFFELSALGHERPVCTNHRHIHVAQTMRDRYLPTWIQRSNAIFNFFLSTLLLLLLLLFFCTYMQQSINIFFSLLSKSHTIKSISFLFSMSFIDRSTTKLHIAPNKSSTSRHSYHVQK